MVKTGLVAEGLGLTEQSEPAVPRGLRTKQRRAGRSRSRPARDLERA